MTRRTLGFASLLLFFLPLSALVAQDRAAAYLEQAHLLGTAERLRVDAQLAITTSRGTQQRGIEAYLEQRGEGSAIFAQVQSPAFLRNMKFLVLRQDSQREDVWLRTSHGVRRVAAGDGDTAVFNSHFLVRDFSFVQPLDFHLSIVSESDDAVVIEARDPRDLEDTRLYTINPGSGLVHGVEYLDAAGGVARRFTVMEVISEGTVVIPRVARMEDLRSGESTTITISRYELPATIPSRIFNRGNL